jgi:leader peptidase (prepilin peptidase)/N-methyltransferase
MTTELFPFAPAWSIAAGIAWFGACIGSFLNVVIHRLPRKQSLLWPRSACPSCERPIPPYENVPVLAWIFLGGRCRGCKAPITPRYVFVEIGVAGLAIVCAWQFGITLQALLMFALLAAMLAVALIDWEHMIIPDGISLGFLVLGLLVSPIAGPGIVKALIGAVAGGGLLLVVAVAWEKLRGVEAMGGGDIKLMAAVGAFLGAIDALLIIFLGAFLGALFGTVLLRRDAQARIAFGTFLSAATFLVVFFGDAAIGWYLRAVGFGS